MIIVSVIFKIYVNPVHVFCDILVAFVLAVLGYFGHWDLADQVEICCVVR